MKDGRSVSPVIGCTDESSIKKVYKSVHKNIDQMKCGPERRRSSFISGKRISQKVDEIVNKVRSKSFSSLNNIDEEGDGGGGD